MKISQWLYGNKILNKYVYLSGNYSNQKVQKEDYFPFKWIILFKAAKVSGSTLMGGRH